MVLYIGVDPGIAGFIAIQNEDNPDITLIPNPVILSQTTGRNRLDGHGLDGILQGFATQPHFLVVEKQQPMRKPIFGRVENTNERIMLDEGAKQGVPASFNTGYGYGMIIMGLVVHKINHLAVGAQKWQRHMFDKIRLSTPKLNSLAKAKELYPHLDIKNNHNKSDALLLMTYAKLVHRAGKGKMLYTTSKFASRSPIDSLLESQALEGSGT